MASPVARCAAKHKPPRLFPRSTRRSGSAPLPLLSAAQRTDVQFRGIAPTAVVVAKDAFSTATFPAVQG